jgi:hypothetical protein
MDTYRPRWLNSGLPGCDRPPQWCQCHHILHWADCGPTTLGNGVLLCGHHHRLVHTSGWTVRIAADGLPEFTPPPTSTLTDNPDATPDDTTDEPADRQSGRSHRGHR